MTPSEFSHKNRSLKTPGITAGIKAPKSNSFHQSTVVLMRVKKTPKAEKRARFRTHIMKRLPRLET